MSRGAGLDLGTAHVRAARLRHVSGAVRLERYLRGDTRADEAPAEAARQEFGGEARKLGALRVGIGGSDLMLRYLPVPPVEDWRLERLMDFETRELESRSNAALASSYNLLPVPKELDEDDTMLLALVREDLLEEEAGRLAPLAVEAFMPNAVALYNTWLALGDHQPATTLIAHLGAGTLDLALVRGSDLYFARSLTTQLAQRDRTLAERLGTDPLRARELVHRHLDLRLATGQRLGPDAERVTRPLLPLYESLPTLLSGAVTLCKAQARLRELSLERVLLSGGAAHTRGLVEFLADRLRVPVEVWDPSEMVDADALPAAEAEALAEDGPGSAVALGLALSQADPDLYALEILTAAARKKRAFRERGLYLVLAGVLAVAYLGFATWREGRLADAAEKAARTARTQVQRIRQADAQAQELLARLERARLLNAELTARAGMGLSAHRFLAHVERALPESLWLTTWAARFEGGANWGRDDLDQVPVMDAAGHAVEESRVASQEFSAFAGRLQQLVGSEEAVLPSARPRGRDLEWSLRAMLLAAPDADEEEEETP